MTLVVVDGRWERGKWVALLDESHHVRSDLVLCGKVVEGGLDAHDVFSSVVFR